jgi:hypothetical protein
MNLRHKIRSHLSSTTALKEPDKKSKKERDRKRTEVVYYRFLIEKW